MSAFAGLRRVIRCAAVAVVVAIGTFQGAEARGPVVASVDAVKIGTYDDFTRVVMHVSVPLSPKLFTLSGPDRLIIDLPRISWHMPSPNGAVRSRLIRSYRFGLLNPSVSRLVFNLTGPAQIVDFKVTPLAGRVGYELDITLGEPVARPFDRYRLANNETVRPDGTLIPGAKPSALPDAPVVDDSTRDTFRQRRFDPQTAEYGALGALFGEVARAPDPLPAPAPAPLASAPPVPDIFAAAPDFPGDIAAEVADLLERPTRVIGAAPFIDLPDPAPEAAPPKTRSDKGAAMALAAPGVVLPPRKIAKTPAKPRRKPFRIVIDPGHGGHDPGAGEVVGLREASTVLAFSAELMALLDADPNYKAFATRDDDTYVSLPDRVAFARKKSANLFISIHADWFDDATVGGAGAYMLSEEDSIRSIDKLVTEKRAKTVAGVDIQAEREDVVRVLLDLERRETQIGSRLFAEMIHDKLSLVTPVKRNFVKHNNFHVLKAPDMPSVLLELGFMSNPEDLARLTSPEWRKTTAMALKEAIDAWRLERGSREIASR